MITLVKIVPEFEHSEEFEPKSGEIYIEITNFSWKPKAKRLKVEAKVNGKTHIHNYLVPVPYFIYEKNHKWAYLPFHQFEQTMVVTDTGVEVLTARPGKRHVPYFMDTK